MSLRSEIVGLPSRDQANRISVIARSVADQLATYEADVMEAEAAANAIRSWADGAEWTGHSFSDLVYSDAERGLLRRLTDTVDQPSAALWNALTSATMYVAYLVYRETGESMPSDVNEVDDETLDLLETQLTESGMPI